MLARIVEANRGVQKEDNIQGHRLGAIRGVVAVFARKCSQLEAVLLVRDAESHPRGRVL